MILTQDHVGCRARRNDGVILYILGVAGRDVWAQSEDRTTTFVERQKAIFELLPDPAPSFFDKKPSERMLARQLMYAKKDANLVKYCTNQYQDIRNYLDDMVAELKRQGVVK